MFFVIFAARDTLRKSIPGKIKHTITKKSSYELKRQYLGLFWDKFLVEDRKIKEAIPTKLIQILIQNNLVIISNEWLPSPTAIITILEDAEYMVSLREKLNLIKKHLEAIFFLVPNPNIGELNAVLKIYENRTDDLKIFMPSSLIEFCKKFKVTEAIPILKFFVETDQISIYERTLALNVISRLTNKKEYFHYVFKKYLTSKDEDKSLSDNANEILIERFKDQEAIDWRFLELNQRAFSFKRPQGVHLVKPQESELRDKKFARCLMQLKNPNYENKFLRLLKNSIDIIKKDSKKYYDYASYLWDIVMAYYNNLKELRNYKYLDNLKKFILENSDKKGMNWFRYKFQEVKTEYIFYLGKPSNIADCIKKYNYYKEIIYLDIATPRDLFELLKKIIVEDMERWWNAEGASSFVRKYEAPSEKNRQEEDLIQKTIKAQFENALLKAGLRKEGISIQRESQLLDKKRTDFLISYGFIGTVLIEIKRFANDEARADTKKGKEYKTTLQSYIHWYEVSFWYIFNISNG